MSLFSAITIVEGLFKEDTISSTIIIQGLKGSYEEAQREEEK